MLASYRPMEGLETNPVVDAPHGDEAYRYGDERGEPAEDAYSAANYAGAVLDSLDAVVFMSDLRTHEILYINKRAEALVGNAVGKRCWEVFHNAAAGPCAFCPVAEILGRDGAPRGTHVEQRHCSLTGRWSEGRHQAVRLDGGRLAHLEIVTEISQRQPVPAGRVQAEKYLEIAATMVVALDAQGRVTLANPKACHVLGYDETALLGKVWAEVTTPPDHLPSRRAAGRPLVPVIDYHEDDVVTHDGRHRTIAWRTSLVIDETGVVNGSLNLGEDITDRREIEENLRFLARHDTLTGLPNGEALTERLAEAIARAKRSRATVGVLYLDIDGLNAINTRHGQSVGDAVLRVAAERLQQRLREVDMAARMVGDEFAVVLEGPSNWTSTVRVAEKIIDSLAAPFSIGGTDISVTTSVGIVIYPTDGLTAEALLRNAAKAMQGAKDAGKNGYHSWHQKAG